MLRLVEGFQELGRTAPDICRDVNLTRKELRLRWSSAPEHQNMLEAFLQILVDEEFLTEMEGTAGRVLIVDPDEAQSCLLAPTLVSVGYEVITVPDPGMAEEFMPDFRPDAVIVEAGLPNQAGLQLCEKIKGRPDTNHTVILAVVEQNNNRLAVHCLSSGADDFVSRPVDPELLMLKLQSRLDAAPAHETGLRGGVSGSLDDMSFTDLIQILSAGRKSLCVRLMQGDITGYVFVKDGNVVHAQIGDLSGEAAFYEMMRWTTGAFNATQCAEFPNDTIHVSTMSLLMEGARLADEGSSDT